MNLSMKLFYGSVKYIWGRRFMRSKIRDQKKKVEVSTGTLMGRESGVRDGVFFPALK
jgi:hypothetical protein